MKVLTGSTLALVLAQLWAASVQAADYPERNITVIVPFPAGGASDMTARLVTPKLAERVKQSVIVDNRAGANGSLGATAMKQAPADGYTLLVGSIGVFAINPALYKDLRYDPQKDFDLLSVVVRTPNVLVAHPGFPANTVRELIEHLNKNPGKITFASSGTGSSDHLTAALFWQKTGTTGIHVPYRGGGPAINDLIAGHVAGVLVLARTEDLPADLTAAGLLTALSYVERRYDAPGLDEYLVSPIHASPARRELKGAKT